MHAVAHSLTSTPAASRPRGCCGSMPKRRAAGSTPSTASAAKQQCSSGTQPELLPAAGLSGGDLEQPQPQPHWRLELFFKTPDELQAQLPFIRSHRLMQLNITNKAADDDLLATLAALQPQQGLLPPHTAPAGAAAGTGSAPAQTAAIQPGAGTNSLDVCLHYSLKYNTTRTAEGSLAKLLEFCEQLNSSLPAAPAVRVHVLLVSGGGKKKRFDSLAALQALQQQQQGEALLLPRLAVAFNPYLPDAAAAAEEQARLQAKLATGLVDAVYLQVGSDLPRLQAGLAFLQDLQQQQQPDSRAAPALFGSVLLPTNRLLAQMRSRPWSGVFLSEEYLSSVEAAEAITQEVLQAYAAAGVVPLLESAVKTDAELQRATALLGSVQWQQEAGAGHAQ